MRGDFAGQGAARNMRKRDQRVVERVRREVDESSFQRPVLFDRALPGEPPVDIVVRAEHCGDAREDFGLVPFDPSELRRDKLLIDSIAGLGEKDLFVDLRAKLLDFRAAARIALLNAGPQQAPGRIEKHHSRQHPRHADSGDVGCGDSSRVQELAHDLADIAPPLLGVLLRPTNMVRAQGDRARGKCECLVRGPDEHADGRRRADVEAENAGHEVAAHTRASLDSDFAPDHWGSIGFPRSRK